jgi:hypothetical protein
MARSNGRTRPSIAKHATPLAAELKRATSGVRPQRLAGPAAVSVIPVQENPTPRALQLFDLTIAEYHVLKLCAQGVSPSDLTMWQCSLVRELKNKDFVRMGIISKAWQTTGLGETAIGVAAIMSTDNIASGPAKLFHFPASK